MANTRQDVIILKGVWTDLYAASGIAVGTAISIVNKGSNSFDVAISVAAPTVVKGFPVYSGAVSSVISIQAAASGAWAFSAAGNSLALVQE
jgi:hypothetical protein